MLDGTYAPLPDSQVGLTNRAMRWIGGGTQEDTGDNLTDANNAKGIIEAIEIIVDPTTAKKSLNLNGHNYEEVRDALTELTGDLLLKYKRPWANDSEGNRETYFNTDAQILDEDLFRKVIDLAKLDNQSRVDASVKEAATETIMATVQAGRKSAKSGYVAKGNYDLIEKIIANRGDKERQGALNELLTRISQRSLWGSHSFEDKLQAECDDIRNSCGALGESLAAVIEHEVNTVLNNPELILSEKTESGRRFLNDRHLLPVAQEFQRTLGRIWDSQLNPQMNNPFVEPLRKIAFNLPNSVTHREGIEEFAKLIQDLNARLSKSKKAVAKHTEWTKRLVGTKGLKREVPFAYATKDEIQNFIANNIAGTHTTESVDVMERQLDRHFKAGGELSGINDITAITSEAQMRSLYQELNQLHELDVLSLESARKRLEDQFPATGIRTTVTDSHINKAQNLQTEVREQTDALKDEYVHSYFKDINEAMTEVPNFGKYLLGRL